MLLGCVLSNVIITFIAMKRTKSNEQAEPENKPSQSTKQYGSKLTGRSKITNGTHLLPRVDGRSIWASLPSSDTCASLACPTEASHKAPQDQARPPPR